VWGSVELGYEDGRRRCRGGGLGDGRGGSHATTEENDPTRGERRHEEGRGSRPGC
jgi:hypothetical protein